MRFYPGDMDSLFNEVRLANGNSVVLAEAMETLSEYGESAIPKLLKFLEDENSDVRGLAADTLGYIGNEAVFEPLLHLVDDEDKWVRVYAVKAVGRLKGRDSRAVEPLLEVLRDGDSDLREAAALALGGYEDIRVLPVLLEVSRTDIDKVSSAAQTSATYIQLRGKPTK